MTRFKIDLVIEKDGVTAEDVVDYLWYHFPDFGRLVENKVYEIDDDQSYS